MTSHRVFTIEPEIIKVLHKYVFGYEYEICAHLQTTEKGNLIPRNVLKGSVDEKGRGTCRHQGYTSNILHTHPPSSYSYPSTEDIIKVIKHHGKIVNSLIGTKWGIWVMSNTTSSNIYSPSQEVNISNKIKKYLDTIGYSTRTSEEERKTSPDKSRNLSPDDHILIAKMVKKISDMLLIKIELYSWDDVYNGLTIRGLTEYE